MPDGSTGACGSSLVASATTAAISASTGGSIVGTDDSAATTAGARDVGAEEAAAAADGSAGMPVASRPDSASARAMMASTSTVACTPLSISSTSCGMAATASRTTATMSGERASVWLITRFKTLSMLQENSPTRRAPTMRPLPFSVWNARRTSRSASASSGFCSHCGNKVCSCVMFSRASSTNRSTNSRSTVVAAGAGRCRRRGRTRRLCSGGRRDRWRRRRFERRRSFAGARRAQRNDARRRWLDRSETRVGGIEHLPLVGAAGLQHLHVVLDGHDGVGDAVETRRGERARSRAHDGAERAPDVLHHLDGALLAEHQQPGRDAAHQGRNLVQALRLGRRRERLRHGLLDARHVDDALAQHGLLDMLEFLVGRLAGPARPCATRAGSTAPAGRRGCPRRKSAPPRCRAAWRRRARCAGRRSTAATRSRPARGRAARRARARRACR